MTYERTGLTYRTGAWVVPSQEQSPMRKGPLRQKRFTHVALDDSKRTIVVGIMRLKVEEPKLRDSQKTTAPAPASLPGEAPRPPGARVAGRAPLDRDAESTLRVPRVGTHGPGVRLDRRASPGQRGGPGAPECRPRGDVPLPGACGPVFAVDTFAGQAYAFTQPEFSTTKPTKAPQVREGQEFSRDAAGKNLSRPAGASLNPEAQYYLAFLWCLGGETEMFGLKPSGDPTLFAGRAGSVRSLPH